MASRSHHRIQHEHYKLNLAKKLDHPVCILTEMVFCRSIQLSKLQFGFTNQFSTKCSQFCYDSWLTEARSEIEQISVLTEPAHRINHSTTSSCLLVHQGFYEFYLHVISWQCGLGSSTSRSYETAHRELYRRSRLGLVHRACQAQRLGLVIGLGS